MASTTTYTCDRCGYSCDGGKKEMVHMHDLEEMKEGRRQFWSVGITHQYGVDSLDHASTQWKLFRGVHWCRTCMAELGLFGEDDERKPVQKPDPEPTIEDFIREIVREEIDWDR